MSADAPPTIGLAMSSNIASANRCDAPFGFIILSPCFARSKSPRQDGRVCSPPMTHDRANLQLAFSLTARLGKTHRQSEGQNVDGLLSETEVVRGRNERTPVG